MTNNFPFPPQVLQTAIGAAVEHYIKTINASTKIAFGTEIDLGILKQKVLGEGVRPRETFVYRPGGNDIGPVVYNNFDDLHVAIEQNKSSDVATTIVLDNSHAPIIFDKQYDLSFCTLEGFRRSIADKLDVEIGANGTLHNLAGLYGINLKLHDSPTHTSLNFRPVSGHCSLFTMTASQLSGLTNATIVTNSNCVNIEQETRLYVLLQLGSNIPSISQMEGSLSGSDNGYIKLNGVTSNTPNEINLFVSCINGGSFHESVLYSDSLPSGVVNGVSTFTDSTSSIKAFTHPTNVAVENRNMTSMASNIMYDVTSPLVPTPANPSGVTVKEEIDALVTLVQSNIGAIDNLTVNNTSHLIGPVTADSTLTVNSTSTFNDFVSIVSGARVFGQLEVDNGAILLGVVNTNSNVDVGGHLGVGGTSTLAGDVHLLSSLTVDYNTNLSNNIKTTSTQLGFYNQPTITRPSPSAHDTTYAAGTGSVVHNDSQFGIGGWTITDVVLALERLGLLGTA